MKFPYGKTDEGRIPYYILWLVLGFFSLLTLASFFLSGSGDSVDPPSPYAQGYFIRSRASGSIRIIPHAGAAFKSPVSNTIKAVVSPYVEEDENAPPARQKTESY